MILKVFLFIILAYLLFEFIEHAVIPLVWLILKKKKKPVTGTSGLIGEVGEVKEWSNTEGRIFVHGELWWATSEEPLSPGDKAVVQSVQGLTLMVNRTKRQIYDNFFNPASLLLASSTSARPESGFLFNLLRLVF